MELSVVALPGMFTSFTRIHLQRIHLQRIHLQRIHLQRIHLQRILFFIRCLRHLILIV